MQHMAFLRRVVVVMGRWGGDREYRLYTWGASSQETEDNSLLVELWCGCWMVPELTIIDE